MPPSQMPLKQTQQNCGRNAGGWRSISPPTSPLPRVSCSSAKSPPPKRMCGGRCPKKPSPSPPPCRQGYERLYTTTQKRSADRTSKRGECTHGPRKCTSNPPSVSPRLPSRGVHGVLSSGPWPPVRQFQPHQ